MAVFNTPETRILIRILAVFGLIILLVLAGAYLFLRIKSPHLLRFSKGVTEFRIEVPVDSLENMQFLQGMNGCENLALKADGNGLYVSCLDGNIHYIERGLNGLFEIILTKKAGNQVTGLAIDRNGVLLAGVNHNRPEEWKTSGGNIERFARDLTGRLKLTEDFSSLNGIAADRQGNIYFASSNFSIFSPEGSVYRMSGTDSISFASPVKFIPDAGLANGIYYDARRNELYFSNTVEGVYRVSLPDGVPEEVYLKLRFMEACDDLCTDIGGNIWMTDPGYSTVKMFNPGTGRLVRFVIKGVGQTSSVRIRTEEGMEVLYITELKQKQSVRSTVFDGRGVLIVPTRSLIRLLEPILIPDQKL